MIMQAKDQKTYPHLATFVRTKLPLVRHKPTVWKAFKKFAIDLSSSRGWQEKAGRAVQWGPAPTLYVGEIDWYFLATRKTQKNLGLFNSNYPNRIYLSTSLVSRFETDHTLASAQLCVEAIILHELVHWANHWTGERALFTRTPDGKISVDTHAPEGFEKEAYGGRLIRRW